MKRELKPFVVEVKRGKRRLPFGEIIERAKEQVTEAGRRADIALFASAPEQPATLKAQRAETAGRILPSLIEPKLPADSRDEPPRRRGRKPGSKNKPKIPYLEGIPLSVAKPAAGRLANRPAITNEWSASAASSRLTATEAAATERSRADATLEPGPSGVAVPGSGRIRLRDRSSILARYVFETEPAPGERWKRPTRRASGKARRSAHPV